MNEIIGRLRKLRKEELYNLYSSTNVIVMKSRRTKSAGDAARIAEMRHASMHEVIRTAQFSNTTRRRIVKDVCISTIADMELFGHNPVERRVP
jgi:hypothetical protein